MRKNLVSERVRTALQSTWWIGLVPLAVAAWFWLPSMAPNGQPTSGSAAELTQADRAQPHRGRATMLAANGVQRSDAPSGERQTAALTAVEPKLQPAPVQPPAAPPLETQPAAQPVAHARNAAVRSCLPALQELSQMVVDGQHVAYSTWNTGAANDRLFQSIVGLKYENTTAPYGVSILVAAPMQAEKCDGATVQIQPSALACDKIARTLAGAQLPSADLNGIRLIQATNSTRVVLLPTRGNGCAVVGIGVHYAK